MHSFVKCLFKNVRTSCIEIDLYLTDTEQTISWPVF